MAEEMGYDHHYLSRAFHEMFHMNFRDFVNQYRINYANELLMQGGRSITEVAFESGFQSVRSFNDVYKKMTGSVPSKKEDIRSLPTVNSVSLEKF
jgi:AraC-like DNA-binding protein